jgi:small subunit ribosomal protein S6
MFILDSNRYARDPGGVSGRIPRMVEEFGGEVLASRLWNEQRLAFPINGHRKGAYWLTYFRMDSKKIADFNRACQLNEDVMRNLTLKVDARLVDALVAHARGEPIAPPVEEPASEPAKGASDAEKQDQEPPAAEAEATEQTDATDKTPKQ